LCHVNTFVIIYQHSVTLNWFSNSTQVSTWLRDHYVSHTSWTMHVYAIPLPCLIVNHYIPGHINSKPNLNYVFFSGFNNKCKFPLIKKNARRGNCIFVIDSIELYDTVVRKPFWKLIYFSVRGNKSNLLMDSWTKINELCHKRWLRCHCKYGQGSSYARNSRRLVKTVSIIKRICIYQTNLIAQTSQTRRTKTLVMERTCN